MKKMTLLIVSIVATLSMFSQITLNGNINLTIGDTYRYDGYEEVTNIDPGNGGANLEWDFSTITGEIYIEGVGAICVDPATTPFADSSAVTNANICIRNIYNPDVGPYQYHDNDNSSQNLLAMGFLMQTNNSFTTYTDICTSLEFPFAYGNSFNDTWELLGFHIDYGYYFTRDSAMSTIEADAYGTITTPLGEFQNALRIKTTTIDYSWYRYEAGGDWIPSGPFTDIEYTWYVPNIKVPVMIITELDGFTSYSVRYLVEYDFTTRIEDHLNHQIETFPNPVINQVVIKTDKPFNSFSIYSINGQRLEAHNLVSNLSHQQTIDLSQYPKGIYFIEIVLENGNSLTKKIIKQ